MNDSVMWIAIAFGAVAVVLVIAVMVRASKSNDDASKELRDEFRVNRDEARNAARDLRDEVTGTLRTTNETLTTTLEAVARLQETQLGAMTLQVKSLTESNQAALDRIRTALDTRVKELQDGNERKLEDIRKTVDDKLHLTLEKKLGESFKLVRDLSESNQLALDRIRIAVDTRVRELQEGNEKKLDEMRRTVDEKLHDTLEKRLGESFKLVSDRLEAVHKGLGEMQTLASGVGDLRRVLTNVKARGTWAEVQLGAILEQMLASEQFERNVCVKTDTGERVEFAIKLPGPKDDPASCVWLPIDSKFPQEDYIRLQDAAEKADLEALQVASEALARTVRLGAKDIFEKYVNPPNTTDFAIMFLATEGLYAEVLRQPALADELQRRYRVILAGPTTLAAILSSLRMGFQTLAIEQRASEVWRVLGAIKTEFGKFGEVLDKVGRQLNTASRTIEQTGVRSRAIERKLRSIEKLPEAGASEILGLPAATADGDGTDNVNGNAHTEEGEEAE